MFIALMLVVGHRVGVWFVENLQQQFHKQEVLLCRPSLTWIDPDK